MEVQAELSSQIEGYPIRTLENRGWSMIYHSALTMYILIMQDFGW